MLPQGEANYLCKEESTRGSLVELLEGRCYKLQQTPWRSAPLKSKTALITDLDNTIFDWVEVWITCFTTMLDGVLEMSGVPREVLIPEIKAVHQKHGTSEYSFLLEELPSLSPFLNGRRVAEVFAGPIEAFRAARSEKLRLYPTVGETLATIKAIGTQIIGYTESMAFYSNYRVRCLGLDGVFDHLFCPQDHVLPKHLNPEDHKKYPAHRYELQHTKQHYTPEGSRKPDPPVLLSIVKQLGLSRDQCVYVGDSLTKDVVMAVDCKIDDVWAEYGVAHERPGYELLREVTHWTAEDVEREKNIKARDGRPEGWRKNSPRFLPCSHS